MLNNLRFDHGAGVRPIRVFFADEIANLFPYLYGQPSAALVPSAEPVPAKPLKIGVVLSGGQAPGGHNVICGIFGECG